MAFGPLPMAKKEDHRVELGGIVSEGGKGVNQDFEELWVELARRKDLR